MKGVSDILKNTAGVTSLLNDGQSSVFKLVAEQGEKVPHIVIDEVESDPTSTMSGASTMDVVQTRVFCVSSQLYTGSNGISGAWDIKEAVRTALDEMSGTYDGEVIANIEFDSESIFIEGGVDHTRNVCEQVYMVTKRR